MIGWSCRRTLDRAPRLRSAARSKIIPSSAQPRHPAATCLGQPFAFFADIAKCRKYLTLLARETEEETSVKRHKRRRLPAVQYARCLLVCTPATRMASQRSSASGQNNNIARKANLFQITTYASRKTNATTACIVNTPATAPWQLCLKLRQRLLRQRPTAPPHRSLRVESRPASEHRDRDSSGIRPACGH